MRIPNLKDQWLIHDGIMMYDEGLIYRDGIEVILDGIDGNRWRFNEGMKEAET